MVRNAPHRKELDEAASSRQQENEQHPSNGDIAVRMWAEACGAEELERIARFLGKQSIEEGMDE